jgi:hypothetical protein
MVHASNMSDYELESLFKKDTELIYDKHYYNKVFKRVERVCNASFYINSKIKVSEKDSIEIVKNNIESTVVSIVIVSTELLVSDVNVFKRDAAHLSGTLLKLSSLISLLATADRLPMSHALLIEHEVNGLVSDIAEYAKKQNDVKPQRLHGVRQTRMVPMLTSKEHTPFHAADNTVPQGSESGVGNILDRKDKVRSIIREKGQVSIKDISDIIKDVSEKSIQRDLNDMIANGEVVRLGERRWSTYKLS